MKTKKRGILQNNIFILIISLLVSVSIWAAVAMVVTPEETRVFEIAVKINENTPVLTQRGLKAFGANVQTVSVTVSGQKSRLARLSAEAIKLSYNTNAVDISRVYDIDVTPSVSADDIKIVDWSPKKVSVLIDEEIEKEVSVEYDPDTDFAKLIAVQSSNPYNLLTPNKSDYPSFIKTEQEAAKGGDAPAQNMVEFVNPAEKIGAPHKVGVRYVLETPVTTITVKGPSTEVVQVKSVYAAATGITTSTLPVKKSEYSLTLSLNTSSKSVHSSDISFVMPEPAPMATVTVFEVWQMPVSFQVTNFPKITKASQILTANDIVALSSNNIAVIGAPALFDKTAEDTQTLTEVSLGYFDFRRVSAEKTEFSINAAGSLNDYFGAEFFNTKANSEPNYGSSDITLKVNLNGLKLETKSIDIDQASVLFKNPPPNFLAAFKNNVTPRKISVTGPAAVVKSLTAADILANVDLTGVKEGDTVLPLNISVAGQEEVWGWLEVTISVTKQ